MKKKVLGLALAAITMVGFTSMAQTAADSNGKSPRQENIKGKKDMKQGRRAEANPFEGLNLSESQRSQLEQLKQKRQAERTEKAKVAKAERRAGAKAAKAERRAARKEHLAQIKAIIGQENYVTYLENLVLDSRKGKAHRGGKSFAQKRCNGKAHGKHNSNRGGKQKAKRAEAGVSQSKIGS
ncbi:MAG: hypothetical protein NC212_07990 [Staphylococcus sp.]|nr:hypothetical protein [Staphylococcus sp.]